MKKRTRLFKAAIVIMLVVCMGSAIADSVSDHFDDGVLDPAWNITFENALGWTYSEAGTNLTVTDITIDQPFPTQNSSGVILSQGFIAPADFTVESSIAWDCGDSNSAMQNMFICLRNAGQIIFQTGYYDPWVAHRGSKTAMIGTNYYNTGQNTMPLSGSADIKMERVDGEVSIFWDDVLILNDTENIAIDELSIDFMKYTYSGATFGNLSIDYVTATPEPATLALLGFGGLMLTRRRQNKS